MFCGLKKARGHVSQGVLLSLYNHSSSFVCIAGNKSDSYPVCVFDSNALCCQASTLVASETHICLLQIMWFYWLHQLVASSTAGFCSQVRIGENEY